MSEHEAPNKSLLTQHLPGSVLLGAIRDRSESTSARRQTPPRPLASFDRVNSSVSNRLTPLAIFFSR